MLATAVLATATLLRARTRVDERGEGVVSAAIAVLVMAFLGAAMYAGFRATLGKAQERTDDQVSCIGGGGPSCPTTPTT